MGTKGQQRRSDLNGGAQRAFQLQPPNVSGIRLPPLNDALGIQLPR